MISKVQSKLINYIKLHGFTEPVLYNLFSSLLDSCLEILLANGFLAKSAKINQMFLFHNLLTATNILLT